MCCLLRQLSLTLTVTPNPNFLQLVQAVHFLHPAHTHPFNGPFSGTTRVSQYQKGKTNLDFTEARDSEWQWHQLGHMQLCTSLHADNHASTPPLKFFTGRMPFLPPNQQRQSTELYPAIKHDLENLKNLLILPGNELAGQSWIEYWRYINFITYYSH